MYVTCPAYIHFWVIPKMFGATVKHILKDFGQLHVVHANGNTDLQYYRYIVITIYKLHLLCMFKLVDQYVAIVYSNHSVITLIFADFVLKLKMYDLTSLIRVSQSRD